MGEQRKQRVDLLQLQVLQPLRQGKSDFRPGRRFLRLYVLPAAFRRAVPKGLFRGLHHHVVLRQAKDRPLRDRTQHALRQGFVFPAGDLDVFPKLPAAWIFPQGKGISSGNGIQLPRFHGAFQIQEKCVRRSAVAIARLAKAAFLQVRTQDAGGLLFYQRVPFPEALRFAAAGPDLQIGLVHQLPVLLCHEDLQQRHALQAHDLRRTRLKALLPEPFVHQAAHHIRKAQAADGLADQQRRTQQGRRQKRLDRLPKFLHGVFLSQGRRFGGSMFQSGL